MSWTAPPVRSWPPIRSPAASVPVTTRPGRDTDGTTLFVGVHGYAYQIDPDAGQIRHELLLTYGVGVGAYPTALATDGTNLYAGVNGYGYQGVAQQRGG